MVNQVNPTEPKLNIATPLLLDVGMSKQMVLIHLKFTINKMIIILKLLVSHFLVEMFLAPLPMVYVFRILFVFARVCSNACDCNNRNHFFSMPNTTTIYSQLIGKYNFCLKDILQQDILEPVFYDDVIYKS